jgi:hypothetical protein
MEQARTVVVSNTQSQLHIRELKVPMIPVHIDIRTIMLRTINSSCFKKVPRTGGVAQAVEYLPSKHEILRSNPSTTKKKKKKKKSLKKEFPSG